MSNSQPGLRLPSTAIGESVQRLTESPSPEVHSLLLTSITRWDQERGVSAAATAGESEAMRRLRSQVLRIAPYYRTALVTGPAGSGKEGVARLLHSLSPAAEGEFIACEASAFAEAMLRDDGRAILDAVTGSLAGGTLFLEDVGEVPASLQKQLLNIFLIARGTRLRLVTGTHRNLRTMGVTGQFRPDVAQRLMGVEIALAPLESRPEDLRAVVGTLLRRSGAASEQALSEPAMALLLDHSWPGDLAELKTVLRTASTAAGSTAIIAAEHIPALRPAESPLDTAARLERLEDVVQHHVLHVLTRCAGNKLRAAEMLGISRSTLYRMLETCVGEALTAE